MLLATSPLNLSSMRRSSATQLLFLGFLCVSLANRLQKDLTSTDELVLAFYSNLSCLADIQCSRESCAGTDHVNRTDIGVRVCGCDSRCLDEGSCCANYEAACIDEVSPTEEQNPYDPFLIDQQLALSRIDQTIVKCITLGEVELFTVIECKRPLLPGVLDSDVVLCESPRMVMLSQLVPVETELALYRNIHCLRCNGLQEDAILNMIPVEPECSEEYIMEHHQANDFAVVSNLMQAVDSGQCKLFYDFSKIVSPFIACGHFLIDSCNQLYADILPDFDVVQHSCISYNALLQGEFDNQTKIFKNYHCAICNGVTSGLDCLVNMLDGSSPLNPIYLPSFRILLDFSGEASVTLLVDRPCNSDTQVLDVISNECISLPCPPKYILHNSSHCILEQSLLFLRNEHQRRDGLSSIEVCVYHDRNDSANSIAVSRHQLVHEMTVQMVFSNDDIDLHSIDATAAQCADSNDDNQSIRVEAEFPEAIGNLAVRYISTLLMKDLHSLNYLTVNWTRITVKNLGADRSAREISEDLIFVGNTTEDLRLYPSAGSIKLYLPKYGAYIDSAETRVSAELVRVAGRQRTPTFKANVRPMVVFNCTFQSAVSPGVPSCIERADHAAASSGRVKGHTNQESSGGWSAEGILTLVCSSLSIIGLVASLTLFSLFPSLLNLPTRILISLFSVLLMAHVVFLMGGLTLWPPVGCFILAVVQHYAWLSSFAWMNCLSFNLYFRFRMSHVPSDSVNMYAKYSLHGYGFPGLIVAVCITLHFLGLYQYGAPGSCWITGGLQLGLSFGLPVCSMICTNAALFALIIRSLNQTMSDAGLANDVYTTRYKLGIHIKIFSVMGSTWLLGFLSNVDQLAFLSYPFIVLSGSNGFFISLCFMLNQRFISTFKAKLTLFSTSLTAAAK